MSAYGTFNPLFYTFLWLKSKNLVVSRFSEELWVLLKNLVFQISTRDLHVLYPPVIYPYFPGIKCLIEKNMLFWKKIWQPQKKLVLEAVGILERSMIFSGCVFFFGLSGAKKDNTVPSTKVRV